MTKSLNQHNNELSEQVITFLKEKGVDARPAPSIHFCGLPSQYGSILARVGDPKSMSSDYDEFLLTTTHVIRASLTAPYNFHDWRVSWVKEYKTKEELLAIVPKQYVKPTVTAWG